MTRTMVPRDDAWAAGVGSSETRPARSRLILRESIEGLLVRGPSLGHVPAPTGRPIPWTLTPCAARVRDVQRATLAIPEAAFPSRALTTGARIRQSAKWDFLLLARPTLAYDTLRYDVADGVATITLDQPDTRNALSAELLGDLLAAFT